MRVDMCVTPGRTEPPEDCRGCPLSSAAAWAALPTRYTWPDRFPRASPCASFGRCRSGQVGSRGFADPHLPRPVRPGVDDVVILARPRFQQHEAVVGPGDAQTQFRATRSHPRATCRMVSSEGCSPDTWGKSPRSHPPDSPSTKGGRHESQTSVPFSGGTRSHLLRRVPVLGGTAGQPWAKHRRATASALRSSRATR
jgi:hypothetical protein